MLRCWVPRDPQEPSPSQDTPRVRPAPLLRWSCPTADSQARCILCHQGVPTKCLFPLKMREAFPELWAPVPEPRERGL